MYVALAPWCCQILNNGPKASSIDLEPAYRRPNKKKSRSGLVRGPINFSRWLDTLLLYNSEIATTEQCASLCRTNWMTIKPHTKELVYALRTEIADLHFCSFN